VCSILVVPCIENMTLTKVEHIHAGPVLLGTCKVQHTHVGPVVVGTCKVMHNSQTSRRLKLMFSGLVWASKIIVKHLGVIGSLTALLVEECKE